MRFSAFTLYFEWTLLTCGVVLLTHEWFSLILSSTFYSILKLQFTQHLVSLWMQRFTQFFGGSQLDFFCSVQITLKGPETRCNIARNAAPCNRALSRVQISRGVCTPEDRLHRFPVIDQSVSLISRTNSVPLCILLSRISCKLTSRRNSLARRYQFGALDNKSLIRRFVL